MQFIKTITTRGLYWRRVSIQDGQVAKAVFWRWSFSFVLEWPMDEVFWWYLRHCCLDFRSNFTGEFSKYFYVGQNGWNQFPESDILFGLGFPLWGSWYLVYWGRQNARLWSVNFPSVPLVWIKILPVCCALDTGSSAVLAVAPPSLETSGIFLNSGVRYTHFYVFATEIAQIRCIQLQLRYRVDFSAFRMPDTTLDPIFRRRLLHFWSDLKNNLPSNLANLSTSKWISGTRKILVFGVPHMELLISRELRPHRDTFGVYGFPRYHWFTIKFLLSAVRRTRAISQRFGSGSVHVRNFWNDSQQHTQSTTQTFMALPQTPWRFFLIFYVLHKTKSLTFGQEPPMRRSGSNWTHKCIPCDNRYPPKFHPDQSTFGEMAPKKNLFSGHNRARSCQCMGTAIDYTSLRHATQHTASERWRQ